MSNHCFVSTTGAFVEKKSIVKKVFLRKLLRGTYFFKIAFPTQYPVFQIQRTLSES